jgi:hypothetical protein
MTSLEKGRTQQIGMAQKPSTVLLHSLKAAQRYRLRKAEHSSSVWLNSSAKHGV